MPLRGGREHAITRRAFVHSGSIEARPPRGNRKHPHMHKRDAHPFEAKNEPMAHPCASLRLPAAQAGGGSAAQTTTALPPARAPPPAQRPANNLEQRELLRLEGVFADDLIL